MVDSVQLRSAKNRACSAKVQATVEMDDVSCDGIYRRYESATQCANCNRGEIVELKENSQWDRNHQYLTDGIEPTLSEIGEHVDVGIHMMQLMNLPKNRKFVEAAVVPVIEKISDDHGQEEGGDQRHETLPTGKAYVDATKLEVATQGRRRNGG